ncbi:MAG: 50S ribosomal protein L9 [Candidatus Aureabacteria bacterium]|nr:50S ribosomal protein L9 [Candidatus Auribacterota bacterium]
MKIILEKRVEKLGLPGDVINVADGFARNFLLPKKLAVPATQENMDRISRKVKKLELAHVKEVDEAKRVAEAIEQLTVKIDLPAGESGKLFGAVTNHQLADALSEQGVSVDKKKILIASPIKQLGEYQVEIKIHADVSAMLKVVVDKKEE